MKKHRTIQTFSLRRRLRLTKRRVDTTFVTRACVEELALIVEHHTNQLNNHVDLSRRTLV